VLTHELAQALHVDAAIGQALDEIVGGAVGLPRPEVLGDLPQHGALVLEQLGVEGRPALEGVVPQHALAKAVDGEDRGLVVVAQGDQERLSCASASLLGQRLDVTPDVVVPDRFPVEGLKGLTQTESHALVEIGRGRVGEGNDQHAVDGRLEIDEHTQV
jgi:hypothetical protein